MSENYKISDIARALNLSKSTVSRAISGKGRIGQKTKQLVIDYISALEGNTPSASLPVIKNSTIGIVMPTDQDIIDTPFFFGCQLGICEVASLRGYAVLLIPDRSGNAKEFASIIAQNAPQSLIFTRSINDPSIIEAVRSLDIPFVIIGSSTDNNTVQVDSDVIKSCETLTSSLLKNNDKIAFIAGDQKNSVQRNRYDGFLQAHLEAGKYADKSLVFLNCHRSADINASMEKIFQTSARCVIASDDVICEKILRWARDRHIAIPEELRLASFYNSRSLSNNTPPITAINVEPKAVGTAAAELVIDMLEGRKVENRTYVSHDILLRRSTF